MGTYLLIIFVVITILIQGTNEDKSVSIIDISFSRWRTVMTAGGVGVLGGMVVQGGSFIIIPLMAFFVKIPTRITIGSNLAIAMISSTA